MQTVTDWENDIIEENNDKDERKYKIDKDNQKLKNREEVDNYEVNNSKKNDDKNDVKNDIKINDAKKIIEIFD